MTVDSAGDRRRWQIACAEPSCLSLKSSRLAVRSFPATVDHGAGGRLRRVAAPTEAVRRNLPDV